MPKSSPPRALGYEPDPILARRQMSNLVEALNRTRIPTHAVGRPSDICIVRLRESDMQIELRRLVTLWMRSGPHLARMFRKQPALSKRAQEGKVTFYPASSGRGYLEWLPIVTVEASLSPQDKAFELFMTLITNPQWELLGGPCRRCGDYYLKKTKRQNAYCSRVCGSTATAHSTMRRRRQQEHSEKIRRAQDAIHEWGNHKRRLSWKFSVSNRTGYTLRWITRAVNNGELRPPGGSVS